MDPTVIEKDRARVQAIFNEGYDERLYQAGRWANGDPTELDRNDDNRVDRPDSWCLWKLRYLGTWNDYSFAYQYTDTHLRSFRKAMIKVMMLAVAAVLWVDRKLEGKSHS